MRSVWLGLAICFFGLASACGSAEPGEETGGSGAGGDDGEGSDGSGGQTPAGSGGAASADLCEQGCVLTVAVDCDNGPASEDVCVADCEELLAGSCGAQYEAFQTCADGEPVECGDGGIPTVTACNEEQTTFIDCLSAP